MLLPRARDRRDRRAEPLGAGAQLAGVDADVELRELEPEELDAAPQRRQPTVRHPVCAAGPQAAVEEVEIGGEVGGRCVAGPGSRLDPVPQAPPDEAELSPVRLVEVAVAELCRVLGKLARVTRDGLVELLRAGGDPVRDADRAGELPDLRRIGRERQLARPGERLGDGLRPGRGVAVEVAADPRPEAERCRRFREQLPVVGEQQLGDAHQALLEEPEAVPDLVDHAWTLRAHLVGLPQQRHLLRERCLDAPPASRGERLVVELREQAAQAEMGREDGSPRGLGRVCGEHELERELPRRAFELRGLDGRLAQARDRLRERLARCPLLVLVLAAASEAVVLLGEIRELEVDAERAQHERLPFEVEPPDQPTQLLALRGPARRPRAPGEEADPLLLVEQVLALLLDEDPAQDVPEQTDVTPERRVRGVGGRASLAVRRAPAARGAWLSHGTGTVAAHAEDALRPDLGEPRRPRAGRRARPALRRSPPHPRGDLGAGVRGAAARGAPCPSPGSLAGDDGSQRPDRRRTGRSALARPARGAPGELRRVRRTAVRDRQRTRGHRARHRSRARR